MKLSTLGAVSAALAVCATAGAQTPTPVISSYKQVGANVRLGIFFPTDSTTNDVAGTGFFAFGVGYDLDAKLSGLHFGLTVDYYRRSDYGDIPVLLNAGYRSGRLTYFLGAGVGFESIPGRDKTGFAYQAGIDYDLPTSSSLPVFLEAKFLGADRSAVDGVGVYVGVRF